MTTLLTCTTVHLESTRTARTAQLTIDGHPDAIEIVAPLREFIAFELLGIEDQDRVHVDVDLTDGARDGRAWVSFDARPTMTGSITRTVAEPLEATATVAYITGEQVLPGNVVRVGHVGTAFHEVIEISETDAWLRECAGRRRTSTEPIGRLHFYERAFG